MDQLKLLSFISIFLLVLSAEFTFQMEIGTKLENFINKYKKNLGENPCDDFFTYVFGSSDSKSNLKTENVLGIMRGSTIADIYQHRLETASDLSPAEVKLKTYVNSCLHISNPDYLHLLKTYSKWPILDWNSDEEWDWQNVVAQMQSHDISTIIYQLIAKYEYEPLIAISPIYGSYTNKELTDLLAILNLNYTQSELISSKVRCLAQRYQDASSSGYKYENITYKLLKEEIPEFNWDKYFKIATNLEIKDDEIIQINLPVIKKLLQISSEVDQETLAYFLLSKLYKYFAQSFNATGSIKDCYSHVRNRFTPLLSKYLVENYLTGSSVETFLEVFEYMRRATQELQMFRSIETNFTKIFNNFEESVLQSNTLFADLDEDYEDVEVTQNYFQNYLNLERHQRYENHADYKNSNPKTIRRNYLSRVAQYAYFNRNKPKPYILSVIPPQLFFKLSLKKSTIIVPPRIQECLKSHMPTQYLKGGISVDNVASYAGRLAIANKLIENTFKLWKRENKEMYDAENRVLKSHQHSFEKIFYENLIRVIGGTFYFDFEFSEEGQRFVQLIMDTKEIGELYNCPSESWLFKDYPCEI